MPLRGRTVEDAGPYTQRAIPREHSDRGNPFSFSGETDCHGLRPRNDMVFTVKFQQVLAFPKEEVHLPHSTSVFSGVQVWPPENPPSPREKVFKPSPLGKVAKIFDFCRMR